MNLKYLVFALSVLMNACASTQDLSAQIENQQYEKAHKTLKRVSKSKSNRKELGELALKEARKGKNCSEKLFVELLLNQAEVPLEEISEMDFAILDCPGAMERLAVTGSLEEQRFLIVQTFRLIVSRTSERLKKEKGLPIANLATFEHFHQYASVRCLSGDMLMCRMDQAYAEAKPKLDMSAKLGEMLEGLNEAEEINRGKTRSPQFREI